MLATRSSTVRALREMHLQPLWDAHTTRCAACPRDGAALAITVAELDTGVVRNVYRFCCVRCGWTSASFVAIEGIVEAFGV